jgi:DnaJ domain
MFCFAFLPSFFLLFFCISTTCDTRARLAEERKDSDKMHDDARFHREESGFRERSARYERQQSYYRSFFGSRQRREQQQHKPPAKEVSKDNFYAILKVPRTADLDAIQKGFRALAFEWHPDRHQNSPEANAKFQKILEAYQTLRDPKKRAEYDIYSRSV